MRILLCGEFSGLHTNLKAGLLRLGHEVMLASNGDGFKGFHGDIELFPKSPWPGSVWDKTYGRLSRRAGLWAKFLKLKGYDQIQFINPFVFGHSRDAMGFATLLKKSNKRVSVIVAGGDPVVDYGILGSTMAYSFLKEEINHAKIISRQGLETFSYREYLSVLHFMDDAHDIIPCAYEYHFGYSKFENLRKGHPLPIDCQGIEPAYPTGNRPIKLLYGLNRDVNKGTRYIMPALHRVKEKYGDEIDVVTPTRLPFIKYREILKSSDIIIDQCNSYSYGMNALYALAFGKIVLSGAEPEALQYLGVEPTECPVLNIKPSVENIYESLCGLIENWQHLTVLGQKSRAYVEKYHDSLAIAKLYVQTWSE